MQLCQVLMLCNNVQLQSTGNITSVVFIEYFLKVCKNKIPFILRLEPDQYVIKFTVNALQDHLAASLICLPNVTILFHLSGPYDLIKV